MNDLDLLRDHGPEFDPVLPTPHHRLRSRVLADLDVADPGRGAAIRLRRHDPLPRWLLPAGAAAAVCAVMVGIAVWPSGQGAPTPLSTAAGTPSVTAPAGSGAAGPPPAGTFVYTRERVHISGGNPDQLGPRTWTEEFWVSSDGSQQSVVTKTSNWLSRVETCRAWGRTSGCDQPPGYLDDVPEDPEQVQAYLDRRLAAAGDGETKLNTVWLLDQLLGREMSPTARAAVVAAIPRLRDISSFGEVTLAGGLRATAYGTELNPAKPFENNQVLIGADGSYLGFRRISGAFAEIGSDRRVIHTTTRRVLERTVVGELGLRPDGSHVRVPSEPGTDLVRGRPVVIPTP